LKKEFINKKGGWMKNAYLKPINIALVAAIGMSTSGLLAWGVTVKNDARGEIVVTVEEAGACQNDTFIIPAGEERSITTGVGGSCCSDYLRVRGTSGDILNKTAEIRPPGTGFGISCRSYRMVVKQTADNNLIVEQG
jgi:hypothetical protein